MFQRVIPLAVNSFHGFGLETEGVNLPRGAKHARDNGNLEAFDIFEDNSRSFVRRNLFKQLPTDRSEFPILIDSFGDALELTISFQGRHIFSKIAVSHASSLGR